LTYIFVSNTQIVLDLISRFCGEFSPRLSGLPLAIKYNVIAAL